MSNKDSDMHIELSGNRLPMYILVGGFVTLIASIVYATVWLTKLDDRVVDNSEHIAAEKAINDHQTKVLVEIQKNAIKQGVLLEEISKQLHQK